MICSHAASHTTFFQSHYTPDTLAFFFSLQIATVIPQTKAFKQVFLSTWADLQDIHVSSVFMSRINCHFFRTFLVYSILNSHLVPSIVSPCYAPFTKHIAILCGLFLFVWFFNPLPLEYKVHNRYFDLSNTFLLNLALF